MPRNSSTPSDTSAPLALRTRSKVPHLSNSDNPPLPVHTRQRRSNEDSVMPSPTPTPVVPITKTGPPIGQKKMHQSVSATGASASAVQTPDDRAPVL